MADAHSDSAEMNAVQPTTAALKNKSSAATSKKDANAAPPPGTSVLPISKVAKIIKADKEVRLTTKEAIFLIAKCTEMAMGKVVSQAQQNARLHKRTRGVKYEDLATTIARPEWFFLQDIIPQMIAKSDAEKQRAEHPSHVNGGTGTAGAAKAKGNVKEFTGNPVKKARRKSTTATTGAAQKAAVADDSGDAQMDVDA